jgi:hypothetical protein
VQHPSRETVQTSRRAVRSFVRTGVGLLVSIQSASGAVLDLEMFKGGRTASTSASI